MLPETRQLRISLFLSLLLVFLTKVRQGDCSGKQNLIRSNGIDASDLVHYASLTKLTDQIETILHDSVDNLMYAVETQNYYSNETAQLLWQYISMVNQIQKIGDELGSMEEELSQDNMTLDVIQAIKMGKFDEADRTIIDKMDASPSQITRIVHDVYANDNNNFNILLKYFQMTKKNIIRYYVLTALWYQLNSNNHMDPFQLITLYNTLLSYDRLGPIDTSILNELIKRAAETVMSALPTKMNMEHMADMQRLSMALRTSVDNDLYDHVVHYFIAKVYEFYDFTTKIGLVNEMYILYEKNILGMNQFVEVFEIIAGKLRSTQQLDDPTTRVMAHYLKELYKRNISPQLQQKIRVAKNILPVSTMNIFFAEKVRFKNVAHSDYLYASHMTTPLTFRYDACITDNYPLLGISWVLRKIPPYELIFEFESATFDGDFMMNNYYYNDDNTRTLVQPKSDSIDLSVWEIHPAGDEVRIVNWYANKTLCGRYSSWCTGDIRMMGYITSETNDVNSSRCRWIIENALLE